MRLRLREGVTAGQALDALLPLITRASSLNAFDTDTLRGEYLAWVEDIELHLRHLSRDPSVIAWLHTEPYWHIRQLAPTDPRPRPLIDAEATLQRETLHALADDLEERRRRLAGGDGQIIVLDTNVLLHWQEPWKIPWPRVTKVAAVRLVVPLRVVEELDAKKYSDGPKLAARARALLPELERRIGAGGAPVALAEAVTIQVPVEPPPRSRPADADEEILALCAEMPGLTGAHPMLVTGDTGMRLRAQAQGTAVFTPPANYRRQHPDSRHAGVAGS
jgi:hypothetical protein